MVSSKVKQAMRFHKSPKPKHSSTSSSQVQPKPPDIFEVLRLVDYLRDRESQLLTQLLQLKLINESSALESASRRSQVSALLAKLQDLERDNERLRKELAEVRLWGEATREENERRIGELQAEIKGMKESASSSSSTLSSDSEGSSNGGGDAGVSSSQRIWLRQNAGVSSAVEKRLDLTAARMKLLKAVAEVGVKPNDVAESRSMDPSGLKIEKDVVEPPMTHFPYDIEENVESVTLRGPRVPKPPPTKKSSSLLPSTENSPPEKASAPPPAPPPAPPLPPPATTSRQSNKEQVPTTARPPPPPPPPCPATAMARSVPPPPPPPPAPRGGRAAITKVRRVPEVVEFYHSLMRRETRRDAGSIGPTTMPDSSVTATATTTNARDMIGEIENRSMHLLAIKTDVETQGDFIRFLIKEVEESGFTEIDDVVPFVKWLDDELSYLVDERAVLKHFDWPEQKADALREAAFGYCDVKKLESEASSFRDVSRQPYGQALKKIQSLLEKLEHGVYNLSRMRESAVNRYKLFRIPTDWMLENGIVIQIKLASVKLAMQFMKRVSAELENVGGGPEEEELIVHGVRFAFRVHQFAGGFDVETMKAFQELRDKARSCHVQSQNQQQQQKIVCKSMQ